MPDSVNFDPVAHLYDATRQAPEWAYDALPSLLELAGRDARLLEAGVGTGRIASRLLALGANLTGIDLSAAMMARLKQKNPGARLALADATRLPFPAAAFDAVITSHVMHLIPDWRAALSEFRRITGPGGLYLNVGIVQTGESARRDSQRFWREWIEANVPGWQGWPGSVSHDDMLPELEALGASNIVIDSATFSLPYTLRSVVDGFRARAWSSTWDIPGEVLRPSVDALSAYINATHGGIDAPQVDEAVFRMYVAEFGR